MVGEPPSLQRFLSSPGEQRASLAAAPDDAARRLHCLDIWMDHHATGEYGECRAGGHWCQIAATGTARIRSPSEKHVGPVCNTIP